MCKHYYSTDLEVCTIKRSLHIVVLMRVNELSAAGRRG